MLETTLSKTARAAESLANSIMINHLINTPPTIDDSEYVELLATIVTSTFTPAEA